MRGWAGCGTGWAWTGGTSRDVRTRGRASGLRRLKQKGKRMRLCGGEEWGRGWVGEECLGEGAGRVEGVWVGCLGMWQETE